MEKLGFCLNRLPLTDRKNEHSIDYAVLNFIIDSFIEKGGRFFDTSCTYHGGISEEAAGISLSERYPRDSFVLSDSLPSWIVRNKEDCRRIFEKQLSRCKTDYFDLYTLQWINETNYITAETFGEFEFLEELKAEGKALKTGFSFYGSPELLDKILSEHPETDYVRLQINCLDWESYAFRARECYEVAVKHGKKIIAEEPLKCGVLFKIPSEKEKVVSFAIGFVKNLPEAEYVLAEPEILKSLPEKDELSEEEISVLWNETEKIRLEKAVPCIGCSACSKVCPLEIPVSEYFGIYNEYSLNPEESWKIDHVYSDLTRNFSRPSDCLRCRICERECPRGINIVEMLQKVARTFGY